MFIQNLCVIIFYSVTYLNTFWKYFSSQVLLTNNEAFLLRAKKYSFHSPHSEKTLNLTSKINWKFLSSPPFKSKQRNNLISVRKKKQLPTIIVSSGQIFIFVLFSFFSPVCICLKTFKRDSV